MKNKGFEPPRTISETIFQFLKKSIIEGKMKPTQRLQEKEIAELFGVSTTPVREAFQRLAAEKYLILSARREVVVAGVSSKEIEELFEVIRVLDTHATKKALKEMSDRDMKELKKMTEKLDESYKKNRIQSYVKQNYKIQEATRKIPEANIRILTKQLIETNLRDAGSRNISFARPDTNVIKKEITKSIEMLKSAGYSTDEIDKIISDLKQKYGWFK